MPAMRRMQASGVGVAVGAIPDTKVAVGVGAATFATDVDVAVRVAVGVDAEDDASSAAILPSNAAIIAFNAATSASSALNLLGMSASPPDSDVAVGLGVCVGWDVGDAVASDTDVGVAVGVGGTGAGSQKGKPISTKSL